MFVARETTAQAPFAGITASQPMMKRNVLHSGSLRESFESLAPPETKSRVKNDGLLRIIYFIF
jgi:hypothetical protein